LFPFIQFIRLLHFDFRLIPVVASFLEGNNR
jgi:hypothetical protein